MKQLAGALLFGSVLFASSAFAANTAAYVQDGLVACWDGYENAGPNLHDPNATTWKNLAPTDSAADYDLAVMANGSWGESWLNVNGPSAKGASAAPNYQTIEIFCRMTEAPTYSICFYSYLPHRWFLIDKQGTKAYFDVGVYTPCITQTFSATADCGYAATYENDAVSAVFADGVPPAEPATHLESWGNNASCMVIGSRATSGMNYPWTGRVYAIRLYDRALSPEEIAANHAVDVERFVDGNLFWEGFVVSAEPAQVGVPTPGYGFTAFSSGSQVFTMTTPVVTLPGNRYACTGWRIDYQDGTSESGTGLSKTLTYAKPFTFTWLFDDEPGFYGETIYVKPTGDDETGDGTEEKPFLTESHAMDVAVDGDTVRVEGLNDVVDPFVVTKRARLEVVDSTLAHTTENYPIGVDGAKIKAENSTLALPWTLTKNAKQGLVGNGISVSLTNSAWLGYCSISGAGNTFALTNSQFGAQQGVPYVDAFGNSFADTTAGQRFYLTGSQTLAEFVNSDVWLQNAAGSLTLEGDHNTLRFLGGGLYGNITLKGGTNTMEWVGVTNKIAGATFQGAGATLLAKDVETGALNVYCDDFSGVISNTKISVLYSVANIALGNSTYACRNADVTLVNCMLTGPISFSGKAANSTVRLLEPAATSFKHAMAGRGNSLSFGKKTSGVADSYYMTFADAGVSNLVEFLPGVVQTWNVDGDNLPRGTNCILRLNDAEITNASSKVLAVTDAKHAASRGCAVEFCGSQPKLLLKNSLYSNHSALQLGDASGAALPGMPRLKFVLPQVPYEEAPIQVLFDGKIDIYGNAVFEVDLNGYKPPLGKSRIPIVTKTLKSTESYATSVNVAGVNASAVFPKEAQRYNAAFEYVEDDKTLYLTFDRQQSTSADYVQGGLVACWDATDNVGVGQHDAGTKVWKNLAASGAAYDLAVVGKGAWGETWLSVDGLSAVGASVAPACRSVEVVYSMEADLATASTACCFASGDALRNVVFTRGADGAETVFFAGNGEETLAQTVKFAAGARHSAVANYDTNGAVDGVLLDGVPGGDEETAPSASASAISVGNVAADGALPWKGRVHSIRLYDHELSAAEAAENRAVDEERFGELGELLAVTAEPAKMGTPSVPYGVIKNPSGSYSFTMTTPEVTRPDGKYVCTSWRIDFADGSPSQSGLGTSASFAYTKPCTFTWIFEESGYHGDVIYVMPEGDDATADGGPDYPFLTEPRAMDFAHDGQTVRVIGENDVSNAFVVTKKVRLELVDSTLVHTNDYYDLVVNGSSVVLTNSTLVFKPATEHGLTGSGMTVAVTNGAWLGGVKVAGSGNTFVLSGSQFNSNKETGYTDAYGNTFFDAAPSTPNRLTLEGERNTMEFDESDVWVSNVDDSGTASVGGSQNTLIVRGGQMHGRMGHDRAGLTVGGGTNTAVFISVTNRMPTVYYNGTGGKFVAVGSQLSTLGVMGSGFEGVVSNSTITTASSAVNVYVGMQANACQDADLTLWDCALTGPVSFGAPERSMRNTVRLLDNAAAVGQYGRYTMDGAENYLGVGPSAGKAESVTNILNLAFKPSSVSNVVELLPGAVFTWQYYASGTTYYDGLPRGTNNVLRINDAMISWNYDTFTTGKRTFNFGNATMENSPESSVEFCGDQPRFFVNSTATTNWCSGLPGGQPLQDAIRLKFVLPPEPYAEAPIQVTQDFASAIYGNTVFEVDLNGYKPPLGKSRIPLWQKTAASATDAKKPYVEIDDLNANAVLPTRYNAKLVYDEESQTLFVTFHRKGFAVILR